MCWTETDRQMHPTSSVCLVLSGIVKRRLPYLCLVSGLWRFALTVPVQGAFGVFGRAAYGVTRQLLYEVLESRLLLIWWIDFLSLRIQPILCFRLWIEAGTDRIREISELSYISIQSEVKGDEFVTCTCCDPCRPLLLCQASLPGRRRGSDGGRLWGRDESRLWSPPAKWKRRRRRRWGGLLTPTSLTWGETGQKISYSVGLSYNHYSRL